jgi:hypothetical protein
LSTTFSNKIAQVLYIVDEIDSFHILFPMILIFFIRKI